ncbi:hypothetical protein [Methanoculleus sp.]|uniref:hypothetical protein n=1 Tax=Methanoculleus sp. TaxID=90427 RepID=UPI0025DA20F7|nr:hypothetical protein [Methanoculleus sp.]MCK9320295.1 hypothetical protein [Methanoculleus sp.]
MGTNGGEFLIWVLGWIFALLLVSCGVIIAIDHAEIKHRAIKLNIGNYYSVNGFTVFKFHAEMVEKKEELNNVK